MSRQAALWILILTILVGVGLRSYELTARSLWFDEAFSWRLIQFPFEEMINRAAADVHPPLYYILLRGWGTVFGTSLQSLRSFSVTLAAGTILAAYNFAAYATSNRRIGIITALLVAVSGWQIAFAWEARMYTLGTMLALISTWALLHAIRAKTLSWWLLYTVLAAAFAYTHYFAFFTIAAQALFVAGFLLYQTRGRIGELIHLPTAWYAFLAAVGMIGLYAPWIPIFLRQNAQVQESYWVPAIGGWSIPDTFYRMVAPTAGIPPHMGVAMTLAILPIVGAVVLWGVLPLARRYKDAYVLTALLGFIPFLMAVVISFIGQSVYQDRFLVFANIFILVGVALLIGLLPRRYVAWAAAIVGIGLLVTSIQYWNELQILDRPGSQGATDYVVSQISDNQPVIVTSPFIYFSVIHYLEEKYNHTHSAKLYSETGELIHFAGGPILKQSDITGPSSFSTSSSNIIWLVETNGFGGDKLPLPSGWSVADEQMYPEVFPHQGQVFVRKITRR